MKNVHILLVEDNEGDILLTVEALEEGRIANVIEVARDGQEAVNKLEADLVNNNLPDLILLDINLPKMNGHEVLEKLKKNENFKHIPVIILSTSSSEMDIMKSYNNHANCFITKPVEIDDFVKAIESIEDFWFSIVKLPNI
jgi:CheY-like chemotaxis protein